MKYHANAALTVNQRRELQRRREEGWTIRRLAEHYGINPSTVQRWLKRDEVQDRSSAPHQHGRRVVTDAYREAVLHYRQTHPQHGPRRIAHDLRAQYPTANVATVWRILHSAGLSQRAEKKTDAPSAAGGTPSRADGHPGTARD